METFAVIVAAGRGERMLSEQPKAFLDLMGVPILRRAVRAFESAASVDALVVVVAAGEVARAQHLLRDVAKPLTVVTGGARRQDSVMAGLKEARRDFSGVVLVHDAARPLVTATIIDAVADSAREHGAALPVLPIVDTVKRVRDGRVLETIDREELTGAQTPQGFRYPLLMRAYELAREDGITVTDEALAVERLGAPVMVVAGAAINRKLTTREDLDWAERMVMERSR